MRVISCLVIVLSVTATYSAHGFTRSDRNGMEAMAQCGAESQAGMHACLVRLQTESVRSLSSAEREAAKALGDWDEDTRFVQLAREKLMRSSRAFEQYRESQCDFAASLGGGAISNAIELRRLACRVALNKARAAQLESIAAELPAR